jgi:hypothetical protein
LEEDEVQNNENTDIIVLVWSQGLAPATKFAPLILFTAHLKVTVGNTVGNIPELCALYTWTI